MSLIKDIRREADELLEANENLTYGQCIFLAAVGEYDTAAELAQTEFDPWNDNRKIEDFLLEVERLFHEDLKNKADLASRIAVRTAPLNSDDSNETFVHRYGES